MRSYAQLARTLPMPTAEQTRAFAEHITTAHSWYKHLSLFTSRPFVLYLDPNAGRAMVHTDDDKVDFVDHDKSTRFHYTWQPTASYRQRFGYWNYHAPFGSSFRYARDPGVVDTAGSGLRVRFAKEEWVDVPVDLINAGTAYVSALMFAYPSESASRDARNDREHRLEILFCGTPLLLGWADGELLELQLQRSREWPEDIADGFREPVALWRDDSYRHEHRMATDARDAVSLKHESRSRGRLIMSAAGNAERIEVMRRWDQAAPRRKERELIDALFTAVERERQRQIGGVIAAMERVLRMLDA